MNRENTVLFTGKKGDITYADLVKALYRVKADQCDILFIHSELNFGKMANGLKRRELCSLIMDALLELKVKTLVFPTFTFSFSNFETYDVLNSKTKMGMLNEFARKMPGAVRTLDPMTSVCILGEQKELAELSGKNSIGAGSFFDNLHKTQKIVRFLFLGTTIGQCYTHMHFTEEQLKVPYRYEKEFSGTIIDADGNTYEDVYTLYVKYRDVLPEVPLSFERTLIEKGIAVKTKLGDSEVLSMTEKEAYAETEKWLLQDVNCFLSEPYDTKPLVKDYHYRNVTTIQ